MPRSLSAKLILIGGGTVAIILVVASSLSAWQTRSRVEADVMVQANAEARSIANDIGRRLADAGSAANAMTGVITNGYSAGSTPTAAIRWPRSASKPRISPGSPVN